MNTVGLPDHIWNNSSFREWHDAQTNAGNRLDGAEVLWEFRVGPKQSFLFAFAVKVNVWVESEQRHKDNEFILCRPDIACIVAYRGDEVCLIREFRSPARTQDGFIHEVPGGSSWKPNADPYQLMAHELAEETGLQNIDPLRLRRIGSRQLAGTLSTHKAHVFAYHLSRQELEYIKAQQEKGTAFGVEADSERTYIEVRSLNSLLDPASDHVDWSMLGMILSAVREQ
jgi:ADP-ribose pyrophosphatase YjhB (NUDIX family)